MDLILYHVDVFTDMPFAGNPAGVVPDAGDITDNDMQNIAKEINLSETAFITEKGKGEYQVRFFTPKGEIDICGHATIAAFYTLAYKGYINNKEDGIIKVYQQTKVGRLPVEIYFKEGKINNVMMTLKNPKHITSVNELDGLLEALSLKKEDIGLKNMELSPEIISTGVPDLILPVKNKDILKKIKVNIEKTIEISRKLNIVGIHVFTCEDLNRKDGYYCRNFAPLMGIVEESATGTSNGSLIYYLTKNKVINGNEIIVNQGEYLDRASKIYCTIESNKGSYIVKVGGRAKIVMESVILL